MKKLLTLIGLIATIGMEAQSMATLLCDFDSIRKVRVKDYTGTIDTMFANPMTTGMNTSSVCARYIRKNIQYDNLKLYPYTKFVDISPFAQASTTSKISLMMMSKMPVGTAVEVQLGSRVYPNYPEGIHSVYTATTTVTNQWELLTFNLGTNLSSSGGFPYSGSIDKMVILFNPTGTTADTVYFDMVMGPGTEMATGVTKYNANNFSIGQNEPNPARDKTSITINLNQACTVSAVVYDLLGKPVCNVADRGMNPGEHTVDIDTAALPSGVYFYTVKAGSQAETKRMIISR